MPLLPNTPMERLTNSPRSRHNLVSMSKGLPIQKLPSSSLPNTVSTSSWEAVNAREKWAGMLLAAAGPWSSPITSGMVNWGRTDTVPKATVPCNAWITKGSSAGRGVYFMRGSVLPRPTSVTTPKNRLLDPWSVTNVPTLICSTDTSGSNRISTPLATEPSITIPRGCPCCAASRPFPAPLGSKGWVTGPLFAIWSSTGQRRRRVQRPRSGRRWPESQMAGHGTGRLA